MSIYPSDQELEAVQNLVGRAEKILKLVSDKLALEDMKNPEIKKTVTSAKLVKLRSVMHLVRINSDEG